MSRLAPVPAIALLLAMPSLAHAWGSRGHRVVTEVATHLVIERHGSAWGPFVDCSDQLAHLSNVPDLVWRDGTKAVIDANAPTHYLALDQFPKGVPRTWQAAFEQLKSRNIASMGSAPWRIEQLYQMLVQGFEESNREKVYLAAGYLSHFVADYAVPLHTTENYDGQPNNLGLHHFWETAVVNRIPLTLGYGVQWLARRTAPAKAWFGGEPLDAFSAALQLGADSLTVVPRVVALDEQHAVVERNERGRPTRRPAAKVSREFERQVVERMAVGADALARFWAAAWKQAGQGPVPPCQHEPFPLVPAFVPTNYGPD